MRAYELAQLNISRLLAPLDAPLLKDFVDNLERINALAEASPGFVWRLQTDEGDATALRPFGKDIIVNMSVWRDVPSLQAFAFRSAHREFLRRRAEWFEPPSQPMAVLWWVPRGHRPDLAEARTRLEQLRRHGPGAIAFTFREAFAPPGSAAADLPPLLPDTCPVT